MKRAHQLAGPFITATMLMVFLAGLQIRTTCAQSKRMVAHQIALKNGDVFKLELPVGFDIQVAVEGLKRVRFLTRSPDGRIFVTDMYNLSDNRRGTVYVLAGFDSHTGRFQMVTPYLTGLRNPNNLAFFKDQDNQDWIYIALTDKLVRYRYRAGDTRPSGPAQTIAVFPDYGLSYKYGGWHLTRTIAFGPNGKLYVAVGSSCNACIEREEVRASILEMNPDGSALRVFAKGLRNAVGLRWIGNRLMATNQGADHLGDTKPEETLYEINDAADYGWPYCFQFEGRVLGDPKFTRASGCKAVPLAMSGFPAHASALGFDYFAADANSMSQLSDVFLIALHGSTKKSLGHGYRIASVPANGGRPTDFITGFLGAKLEIFGRPCDILRIGRDEFLFTDDKAGVIYRVYKH